METLLIVIITVFHMVFHISTPEGAIMQSLTTVLFARRLVAQTLIL